MKKTIKAKYRTMTLVYILLFAAALVLVNFMASLLSNRLGLRYDMTAESLYALSDETVAMLQFVDQPIEITVFANEEELAETPLFVLPEQLRRYVSVGGGRLSVRYVDPDLNPALVAEFREIAPFIGRYSVAVQNTETQRAKVLLYTDLVEMTETFEIDRFLYSYDLRSEGEFNSAIHFVLSEQVAKAVILTGHEGDYRDVLEPYKGQIHSILTVANFDVEEIDFRNRPLPGDAGLVVVLPTSVDFSKEKIDELEAFLSRPDANTAAILFTMADQEPLPRLDEYLADWGLRLGPQIIYDVQTQIPQLLVPTVVDHDIFGKIAYTGEVIVDSARPLHLLWNANERGNRKIDRLMLSSISSYARDLNNPGTSYGKTHNDEDGPFVIGALGWQSNLNAGTHSRLAVLPGALINPGHDRFSNRQLMFQVCNYFSPSQYSVSIPPKSLDNPPLTLDDVTPFWVLLVAIPVAVMVLGIVVWVKRRHR